MLSALLFRVAMLLGNFLLVVFVSRIWGAEGKGETSIFIANVTLVSMLCQVMAGNAVTFFAPKEGEGKVRFLAYIWAIFSGLVIAVVFNRLIFPTQYSWYFVCFVLLENLLFIHLNIFISRRNYYLFNIFSLLKIFLPLLVFIFIYIQKTDMELSFYFLVSVLSLLFLWAISSLYLRSSWQKPSAKEALLICKKMLHYGWQSQGGMFLTFLRQRYSFYIIGATLSWSQLGVYSVAIAIVESTLSLTRSLGVVLFGELLHAEKKAQQIALTKQTMRVVSLITACVIFTLILLPNWVYTMIFGTEFSELKPVILILLIGIYLDNIAMVVANYFSGINKMKVSNYRAFLGVVLIILLCWYFLPDYGLNGAAWATSLSYGISAGFLIFCFYQKTTFRITDFFPTKKQLLQIKNKIKFK